MHHTAVAKPRRPRPGGTAYLAALFVDALGSGLYLPLTLVFIHEVTGVSATRVGLGVTLAAAVGLTANPVAGILVDRFGSRPVLISTYLVRAAGFALYPLVGSFSAMIAVAAVIAVGDRAYYPATSSYTAAITSGADRDTLYAYVAMARNIGFGLGGLLSAAAVSVIGDGGFAFMALADAASFLGAAACLALGAPHPHDTPAGGGAREDGAEAPDGGGARKGTGSRDGTGSRGGAGARDTDGRRDRGGDGDGDGVTRRRGGYRAVLSDRPFLSLIGAEQAMTLAHAVLPVAVPVYAVVVLHVSPALLGVLFTVNTALLVVGQLPVRRLQARARRTHALALGGAVFAVSCGFYAVVAYLPAGGWRVAALVVATLVYTTGELMHTAPSSALAAAIAPAAARGHYLAVYQLTWGVSSVLAPVGFSTLLETTPALLWAVLAALLLTACAVVLRLSDGLPRSAVSPQPPAPDPTDKARSSPN
jgi:MFS family permease